MAIDKPQSQASSIPPLMAKLPQTQGRLLRKPRQPTVAPPPPVTPPVHHDPEAVIALADQPKEKTNTTDATRYGDNYREFTYVPGASPPPPSEFSVPAEKSPSPVEEEGATSHSPPSRSRTEGSRTKIKSREFDARFIIDPVYRQSTNLGTYVEGQSLVKQFRTRGPQPLPAREPLRQNLLARAPLQFPDVDEQERYYEQPEFCLQDFLKKVAEQEHVSLEKVQQVVYSRHNYKKLQKLLSQMFMQPRTNRRLKTVNMQIPDEVSKATPRVPQKQLVIEMAALIKEQMSAVMNSDMRPIIRPLPKYSPQYRIGEPRPHTEIVLYEEGRRRDASAEISIKLQPEAGQIATRETLFHSATARFFQGSMRSNSPFTGVEDRGYHSYRRSSDIDMVATFNLSSGSDVIVPAASGHHSPNYRPPHVVAFDHVMLPHPPPSYPEESSIQSTPQYGPHGWQHSDKTGSHGGISSSHVTSHVNTLLGDATPRALGISEQQLGDLQSHGSTSVLSRVWGSWDHHKVLPDIREGYGLDESPYVAAGWQNLGGANRLFFYRQDEGAINHATPELIPTIGPSSTEGTSSIHSLSMTQSDSKGNKQKQPAFLSREQTELLISEAEKTFLTDHDLKDGEIMIFGENAERKRRRQMRAEKNSRFKAGDEKDDEAVSLPLTNKLSGDKGSVSFGEQFSQKYAHIVNLEFPRFSRKPDCQTTGKSQPVLKQEESYSSLIPKHVTPHTNPVPSALDHVTATQSHDGHVTIEGVPPGSMEQLMAFGGLVANQRDEMPGQPMAVDDDNIISPSELAILDSLMNGGVALSLKAHFIHDLPDIEPLAKTLTYVNLSFNDFRAVPLEIFDLEQLQTLKLRNNPIRDLPPDLARLKNLRTLIVSFCLITTLPLSLFQLKKLEHLDIAYNKLSFIPSEIRHLKSLRELNVEGNQLAAMPVGMLRLRNLRHLRVRNNFMHPLFWKDNAKNNSQRLSDMAAQVFKSYQLDELFPSLPDKVSSILKTATRCDCCGGVLFGEGLRMIRPVTKIFGIKNLPFMFRSCSPYCYSKFNASSDSLMEQLYGPTTA